jgi:hypothetical protein
MLGLDRRAGRPLPRADRSVPELAPFIAEPAGLSQRVFTLPQACPANLSAMRAKAIILSAVMFGGIGGYAWSSLTAPAARAPAPAKATTVPLPASPEERPAALDEEWASRSNDEALPTTGPATGPVASVAPDRSVTYAGCNEVRAAGKAPLTAGQPGYRTEMDGDGNGIACEPHPGL